MSAGNGESTQPFLGKLREKSFHHSRRTMIQIPGYSVTEQIYTGIKTLVYRALTDDHKSVIIKLTRSEYPSFKELLQFRNQYMIAKKLALPGIIKPYALEPYRNGYVLIMEDFGGISLNNYTTKQATSLQQFLNIAIQITSTLDELHRHQIIHKDIKPSNILINSQLEVKLIDFSIASLLPRETQQHCTPKVLEGTLAYISPEQTGRMNRSVDYRTDLYSLGVTFFELLTQQLPFTSDDLMELVHCHIAVQPPTVHSINREIPLIISNIVAKLMAKNADLRYQSALGLKYDLQKCLSELNQTGSIGLFELGSRDICDRFLIREKLYGREAEVQTLLQAFDRVAVEEMGEQGEKLPNSQAKIEMLLVAGFSGIGKTAVVNEVHKPIVAARGYFIKGKFDQLGRNIPFSGFVQAFRELMGLLLGETDALLQEWKSKIMSALGENAQVIIEVIPELEFILGKQPAAAKLSGIAVTNRFNLLLHNFIHIFTAKEHPLVIFLDDLQWVDSASLKLIQTLMTETDGGHLLLIGAYRNNEVTLGHPLIQTLESIRKAQAKINTITLAPLKESDLNNLIADTLCCAEEIALPLTELIYQKTKGNPFFSNQFLKSLHQEGLIYFNYSPQQQGWACDLTQVKSLALTDDVVEFIALQLQKLPESTQLVLKLAACIGNSFDLNTLSIVHEKSQAETATDLWKALQAGLVLPNSDVYKFYQYSSLVIGQLSLVDDPKQMTLDKGQMTITYRFLHDRVQQAAYLLSSEEQRKLTHLKIGQLLLNNTPVAQQEEKILDIVNQLNIGVDLITNQSEKDDLAFFNLMAGRKAKASTAYIAAMEYFQLGLWLLTANSWVVQYNLTLALYLEVAEVAYLNGNFEHLEEITALIKSHAKSILDQVKLYEVNILGFVAQNKLAVAIDTGLDILHKLGITFAKKPNKANVLLSLISTKSALLGKGIANLVNLPQMTDSYQISVMQIFLAMSPALYFGAPNLYALTICKKLKLSIKYGNTHESALGYLEYGLILCGTMGNIEIGYQFGEIALQLFDRNNIKQLKSRMFMTFYSFISHWKNHINTTIEPLLSAYYSGLETGELDYTGYSINLYSFHLYITGKNLLYTISEISKYSICLEKFQQKQILNHQLFLKQAVLNLIGDSNNICYLIGSAYDEQLMLPILQENNDRTAIFAIYNNKLLICYLFGNYDLAKENMLNAEKYLDAGVGLVHIPLFYFYSSLVHLAIYSNVPMAERRNIRSQVKNNQKKMKKWAKYAPMNHLHKWHLVEAELARVSGKNSQAMEHYDRAINLAYTNEYTQEQAIANELAAKFYLEWGKQNIAQIYLTQAYYCYARSGALAKVENLEKRYPELLAPILQREQTTPFPLENYLMCSINIDVA